MKPKDLICVVGAPVKTAIEIPLVVSMVVVFSGILVFLTIAGRMFIHDHFPVLFRISDTAEIISMGIFVGGIIFMFFSQRTRENYRACKEYWSK